MNDEDPLSVDIQRRAAPVREQVTRVLREAIVSGRFAPGERLTERRLTEMTNVSRTSVREALRNLESDGLVTMVPNQGPIVTVLDVGQARDIYLVRARLEGLAAELFTQNADPALAADLEASLARMQAIVDSGEEGGALLGEKNTFYDILLTGAGSPITAEMLTSLRDRVTILRQTTLSREGRAVETLAELGETVAAIRSGDAQAARDACIFHVEQAGALAVEMLSLMDQADSGAAAATS